jgi:hypothetical protein
MTPSREGGRWRLLVGTAAFVIWAPPSLLGLPLAGLMLAARPRSRAEWSVAVGVGVGSAALLVLPATDVLTAFVHAYTVLVAAAFVGVTVFAAPQETLMRRAARAGLIAGVAVVALASLTLHTSVWGALHWEARRQASATMRVLVEMEPRTFAVYEPVVRFVSDTLPATLALQTLAGLSLAWQWHTRLAQRPFGPPLAPFREFHFGDHWIWAVVASLALWVAPWVTPAVTALKLAALNMLVMLGGLYLVRGLAIVVAFSAAFGIAPAALVIGAVVAAVLAVPLLFLVPGLATLGVTDTWLEFRRRLKAPA